MLSGIARKYLGVNFRMTQHPFNPLTYCLARCSTVRFSSRNKQVILAGIPYRHDPVDIPVRSLKNGICRHGCIERTEVVFW